MVHIHHGLVADVRLHAVALDPHGQLRAERHLPLHGQQLVVLAEHRRGVACRCRRAVQRDGAYLRGGAILLRLRLHQPQRIQHDAQGLPAGQPQFAVFLEQGLLLGADVLPRPTGGVKVAVQVVRLHLQRVEQLPQHALLGRADAGFVVAHRRGRHPQLLCQLLSAVAQLIAPPAQLLAKSHSPPSRQFSTFFDILRLSVRHFLVFVNRKIQETCENGIDITQIL